MKYGLVAETLGHSYSRELHYLFGNNDYEMVEVTKENIDDFFDKRDFLGINVTIPYKKIAASKCDSLMGLAADIGSVNTIINRNGKLIGYNTDCVGFEDTLERMNIDVNGKKTVIFGTGGASVAVRCVLEHRGAEVVNISRNGEDNYNNIFLRHHDADYLVNATPVGMYPDMDKNITQLSAFDTLSGVIDIIYNPWRTNLLVSAKYAGIKNTNGLYMLVSQAAASEDLFFNTTENRRKVIDVHQKMLAKNTNIYFVGMPSAGKSTIGDLFAKQNGMKYIDTDELITAETGKRPKDIILESGEQTFRMIESEMIKKCTECRGTVISTGGGSVLSDKNRQVMLRSGTVVYLKRELPKLTSNDRPLSERKGIKNLFDERKRFYEVSSDLSVDVCDDSNITIQRVSQALETYYNGGKL